MTATVGVKENCCGLTAHAQGDPGLDAGVVKHSKRGCAVFLNELVGLVEAVLSAKSNDCYFILVFTSKLLDIRRFAPTDRSMGRPEPEQDWLGFQGQSSQVYVWPGQVLNHNIGVIRIG